MARGPRREITYTGKAAKIYEKVQKLEADLKAAKAELKIAYKEQVKAEKVAEKKAKQEAEAAAKKAQKEAQAKILKAIQDSGKTPEEIMELLNQ